MHSKTIVGMVLALASQAYAADMPVIAPVQYREVATTYAADGIVEAVKQSTVAAQISGRITEVNFKVGDYVKQGQVIVRIDEAAVSQQVAGSQAQVAAARAQRENAQINLERNRQLVAQNFVSKAALDRAESEYKAAEANLKAAQAGSGQSSTIRSYATITAPYSGIVSAVHVETGDTAFPGKPLMSGFDPSGLRVVANVAQTRLAEIKSGLTARIEVPSLNLWLKPVNQVVQPMADARSLSAQIRLDLPQDSKGLLPGTFARVHFATGQAKKLLVPAEAIIKRSEVTAVYVVDAKGGAQLRQVRLGDATPDGVEVLAGVKPGEQVALEPVKAGLQSR